MCLPCAAVTMGTTADGRHAAAVLHKWRGGAGGGRCGAGASLTESHLVSPAWCPVRTVTAVPTRPAQISATTTMN